MVKSSPRRRSLRPVLQINPTLRRRFMFTPPHPLVEFGHESLCALFVTELEITGASISVSGRHGRQSTVCASGPLAARLDALHFELGEGPRWEVLASRTAVLYPDLACVTDCRCPIFLGAARGLGVESMFSLPMLMGAALVGVVDLYSTSPRTADREFISHGTRLTAFVAGSAVQNALHSAENHSSLESILSPALRREVHQATGMIISQLGVTATEAFARLQAHAFSSGKTIQEVAHYVVARALVLPDDSE